MLTQQTSQKLAVISVLLSSFLFSAKAILIKYSYLQDDLLNGTNLLALRMGFALPFFLLMVVFGKNQKQPSLSDRWRLLIAGFFGYYLASILDFIGLEYITASLERIILFLYPTLTVLFTAFIYKKPISKTVFLALLLSYGGTLMVMLASDDFTASVLHKKQDLLFGSGLVFCASVCYASYLMLASPCIKVFGKWRATGMMMAIASIFSLLHYVIVTPDAITHLLQIKTQSYVYGFLLGVFATVIPASLIIYGIAYIGAAKSALLSAGGPVITLLLATFLLNEQLNQLQWLGCMANIYGVYLISKK